MVNLEANQALFLPVLYKLLYQFLHMCHNAKLCMISK
ncbi:hypothetical protein X975_08892, partial [Stegodyphus mimosarum]